MYIGDKNTIKNLIVVNGSPSRLPLSVWLKNDGHRTKNGSKKLKMIINVLKTAAKDLTTVIKVLKTVAKGQSLTGNTVVYGLDIFGLKNSWTVQ